MPSNNCRRCGAQMLWARHRTDLTNNPLDPQPSPDGNLLVARNDAGVFEYEVLTGEELEAARRRTIALYVSHFATCKERPANKQRREKGTTLPEELLASASTMEAADGLAASIKTKFFWRPQCISHLPRRTV